MQNQRAAALVLGVVALATGCAGRSERTTGNVDDDASGAASGVGGGPAGGGFVMGAGGVTGGTGATGGSSAAGAAAAGVVVVPDANGVIKPDNAPAAEVGVRGAWFAYGDQYGNDLMRPKCLEIGLHLPSECAQITAPPPPPAVGFPNMNGRMHTAGVAEQVLPCPDGLTTAGCPSYDYSDMWGAGIGFNFSDSALSPGGAGVRRFWNPADFGVTGIAFTIDHPPIGVLRIEFPMGLTEEEAAAAGIDYIAPTTDDHPAGAPYWGAQLQGDGAYPGSPVNPGENRIHWTDVAPPELSAYRFDPAVMFGIRFHVSSSIGLATPYDFTISNLTFLRD